MPNLVEFGSAVSEIQASKVTGFPYTRPTGLTTELPLLWEPVIALMYPYSLSLACIVYIFHTSIWYWKLLTSRWTQVGFNQIIKG